MSNPGNSVTYQLLSLIPGGKARPDRIEIAFLHPKLIQIVHRGFTNLRSTN